MMIGSGGRNQSFQHSCNLFNNNHFLHRELIEYLIRFNILEASKIYRQLVVQNLLQIMTNLCILLVLQEYGTNSVPKLALEHIDSHSERSVRRIFMTNKMRS